MTTQHASPSVVDFVKKLLCCVCLLSAAGVFAADKVLSMDAITDAPAALTAYFSVLEDPSAQLTLQDVQSAAYANKFVANQPATEASKAAITKVMTL